MAPLGYLNRHTDDDNNEAIIIVDPVRGPIIKHLFEEFATGKHTLKTLWYLSKELGLYTKNKKKKGCFVSRNTLYDVLTNPFYHGLMCIKGEFYNHIYEPLISKELFDRVQAILTGNGNHNRNNKFKNSKGKEVYQQEIYHIRMSVKADTKKVTYVEYSVYEQNEAIPDGKSRTIMKKVFK